jgi:hypothetical protein
MALQQQLEGPIFATGDKALQELPIVDLRGVPREDALANVFDDTIDPDSTHERSFPAGIEGPP